MSYNLVSENLIKAFEDAENWENSIGLYYKKELQICFKESEDVCYGKDTFERRILDLKSAGASNEDVDFWKSMGLKHSKYKCILEKNHSGKCKFSITSLTNHSGLKLKINDAINNPGANGVFMNRGGAICCQPTLDKESADKIKKTKIKNVAVRLERAATSFQVATGLLDTIAFASLIKNSESVLKLGGMKSIINRHAEFLKTYHKENNKINITNDEGFLQGPILPKTYPLIKLDQFGSGTGSDDYDSIQFTHIEPVSNDKFMSRGLNILFATKVENGLMLKYSLNDARKLWKEAVG